VKQTRSDDRPGDVAYNRTDAPL